MVTDATYYGTLLESLYNGLEGLDVSGYRGHASDGWTQARHLDEEGRASEHLEALIDIGQAVDVSPPFLVHAGRLFFHFRYQPDDDSTSQSRLHAAARHALELLDSWHLPTGERTAGDSYEVAMPEPGWVLVAVSFSLRIPRG